MSTLLTLLSLLFPAAPAQTVPDVPGVLEEVQVTATRRTGATLETAPGVSVVGSERLQAASPLILSDALKGVAGAFVQQTTPGQGIPIVRGLKGSEVLHLVDGSRLNNALFRNAPNQYLALIDPAVIERIEVVRGPLSSLYGSDAMGGVVNVLTRKPAFGETSAGASLLLRSADRAKGVQAWFSRGTDRLAYRISASHLDVGNRRTGSGDRLRPSGYEASAASLSAVYQASDAVRWALDFQYLRQPNTPRVDELIPGFGQSQPASEQFAFKPNSRAFGRVGLEVDLNRAWADDFKAGLSYQRIDDDRLTRATGSSQTLDEANASELIGLTGQFYKALNDRFDLVYGIEAYADSVSSARLAISTQTGVGQPVTSRFPDGSDLDSFAAYTHLTGQLTPRLKVMLGARYSSFDVHLPPADRGVGADLDIEDVTGDAGISFQLAPTTYLVANVGRGFRAPNIFDLSTLGARPGNRFNISNPDLGPEKVITADMGVKFGGATWRGELFGFVSDYQDRITSVLTGATTPDGRDVVTSENVASVDLHGVEAAMSWSATDLLSVAMAINYVRGTQTDEVGQKSPADRIPPLNGRLGATFRLGPDWTLEPYVMFADGQNRLSDRDVRDPRIDPAGTDGWATMNLRGIWTPSARWRVTMTLENLADRRYREHGSGLDAAGINLILGVHATL